MHLNVAGHGGVNVRVLVSFLPATLKHNKNTNTSQQSKSLRIHVLLIADCWNAVERQWKM